MSVTVAPGMQRRGSIVTALLVLVGVGALWPTVRSLAGHWEDADNLTYTHGYLIAAISAWLLWRARDRLDAAKISPSWPAIIVTLGLSAAWYIAWMSAIQVGHQMLLPLLLLGMIAGALGLPVARSAAFAIGYLYFAIPVWSEFNDALQALTTFGVSLLIRLTGLPAYIEGNFVHIPSGAFEIAGGCSGLHFMIVGLAVAALYGELDREYLRTRLKLLAIVGLMAIGMNWLRVYVIILNGHLTEMQGYLVQVDHYKFGWVLFGVMLALFFWIARRILPETTSAASVAVAPDRGAVSTTGLIAAVLALVTGPALAAMAAVRAQGEAPVAAVALPDGTGGWVGPEWTSSPWQPKFSGADSTARAEYRHDGRWVVAFVAAYSSQVQGRELVGSGNYILGGPHWGILTEQIGSVGGGKALAYREVESAAPDGERWLVSYFYLVDRATFEGDLATKLYYGLAALAETPRSAVIAAATRCDDTCETARSTVREFFEANAGQLMDSVGKESL